MQNFAEHILDNFFIHSNYANSLLQYILDWFVQILTGNTFQQTCLRWALFSVYPDSPVGDIKQSNWSAVVVFYDHPITCQVILKVSVFSGFPGWLLSGFCVTNHLACQILTHVSKNMTCPQCYIILKAYKFFSLFKNIVSPSLQGHVQNVGVFKTHVPNMPLSASQCASSGSLDCELRSLHGTSICMFTAQVTASESTCSPLCLIHHFSIIFPVSLAS